MVWTLLFTVALAGSPSSVLLEDGSVLGTVSVRAPPDVARSRVSDPVWVSTTEGGGTRVTVTGRDGACLLIDAVSPTVIVDARYSTRQCPTAEGVLATLRSSNAFTEYTTSWRVMPEGTGSRIEYRLSMKTSLSVPRSFISGTLQKRVQGMMEKVGAALDG